MKSKFKPRYFHLHISSIKAKHILQGQTSDVLETRHQRSSIRRPRMPPKSDLSQYLRTHQYTLGAPEPTGDLSIRTHHLKYLRKHPL